MSFMCCAGGHTSKEKGMMAKLMKEHSGLREGVITDDKLKKANAELE